MFNDSDNGQTQYCEECQKWAKKCEKLTQALRDIRECATTEMVEIATRKDYNGFLVLQGISAKVKQVIGENKC